MDDMAINVLNKYFFFIICNIIESLVHILKI